MGRTIVSLAVVLALGACDPADSVSSTTSELPTTSDPTTTSAPTTTSTSPSPTSTTTTTPATATTERERQMASVGVVGCSNTNQAVAGYREISELDRLSSGGLGGGSVSYWGDPVEREHDEYWNKYDSRRPPPGYEETWLQLCLRSDEHEGSFDSAEMEWVAHIVDQIHERDPGIPIWISPVNLYADGVECRAVGIDGPAIASEAADWASESLEDVFRGPDLGPLTASEVIDDQCHPNRAGRTLMGQQLVDFFDDGA